MDKLDQLLDHFGHAIVEYWRGRCPPTRIDDAKAALRAHFEAPRPEGREQDAEKWHYCVAYGFPHKDRGGVNWVAYRENGSVVVADTADAAMDRVLRQRRPQEGSTNE